MKNDHKNSHIEDMDKFIIVGDNPKCYIYDWLETDEMIIKRAKFWERQLKSIKKKK